MARTYTAAAFVKRNMPIAFHGNFPLGQGGLSDQEAVDVAEYFSHQPRPDFANKHRTGPRTRSRPMRGTDAPSGEKKAFPPRGGKPEGGAGASPGPAFFRGQCPVLRALQVLLGGGQFIAQPLHVLLPLTGHLLQPAGLSRPSGSAFGVLARLLQQHRHRGDQQRHAGQAQQAQHDLPEPCLADTDIEPGAQQRWNEHGRRHDGEQRQHAARDHAGAQRTPQRGQRAREAAQSAHHAARQAHGAVCHLAAARQPGQPGRQQHYRAPQHQHAAQQGLEPGHVQCGSSKTPSGMPARPPRMKGSSFASANPRRTVMADSTWPSSEPKTVSTAASRGSSTQAQNDMATMPKAKPDRPCTNPPPPRPAR
ncbi:putative protein FAM10A5 [Manis javanica]|nr:putative protein FAM10A5 [Manis javanica]